MKNVKFYNTKRVLVKQNNKEQIHILGQTMNVWKENNFESEIYLQVSKLRTGVYIVNLTTDRGTTSKKVIIE